ncbi:MAG: hypothetical protein U0270_42250 [Labilithrix sp.]
MTRTAEHLGDRATWAECRLIITELSGLSGGWGVALRGDGDGAVLRATLPTPDQGRGGGLWAREQRLSLSSAQAIGLFTRLVELDVLAFYAARPLRPDEPCAIVSIRNAAGREASAQRPKDVAAPAIDQLLKSASRIARAARDAPCTHEGPLGVAWNPWR